MKIKRSTNDGETSNRDTGETRKSGDLAELDIQDRGDYWVGRNWCIGMDRFSY